MNLPVNAFTFKPEPDFALRLVDWQQVYGRNHLPWSQPTAVDIATEDSEHEQHAYSVWLSEIMLQQTQVVTVLPYYQAFKIRFPTVYELAAASLDEVLALWAGLGYYSRARNLHHCAQMVVARYAGVFPCSVNELITLPGIGRSTAGAIASLAYYQRAAMLDGNVKRVLARHAAISGWSGEAAVTKQLWQAADDYLIADDLAVPAEHHRRYTQGLMDLGATICHKSVPQCLVCPVAKDCQARLLGLIDHLPTPRPKKTIPTHSRNAVVIHTAQGVWLERRVASGLWGGLLSLPEAETVASLSEILQNLGLKDLKQLDSKQVAPATHLNLTMSPLTPWRIHNLKHTFTHYHLQWTIWAITVDISFSLPAPWQYVAWHSIKAVGVPKAVLKLLAI